MIESIHIDTASEDLFKELAPEKREGLPCAVILTALQVEYEAVRLHLSDWQEEVHDNGSTLFESGIFRGIHKTWKVGISQVGMGNTISGIIAERAINHFKPSIMIFVGIAGGIKDVKVGDVVVAEKVYDYECAKIGDETFSRPEVGQVSYALLERSKTVARNNNWKNRIIKARENVPDPIVIIKPIATGEKVITSKESIEYKLIKTHFNDTCAVEMEGYGFLTAVRAYSHIQALVIRGISDLIDNKEQSDKEGFQSVASSNASAFGFEVLSQLLI